MKIDKEKIKRQGKNLWWAGKETVILTAPAISGAAIYHAGAPSIGTPIGLYGTVPWAVGYTGYHYIKGRKYKKKVKK